MLEPNNTNTSDRYIIIEGNVTYMRRERVGIQCKNGTIYHIHNIRVVDCPYEKGMLVQAKCFDISNKIIEITDIIPRITEGDV